MAGGATIGALRFVLGADTAEFEKKLKDAEGALKRVAAVGAAVGTVIGNALTGAFSSLKESVSKALESADNLGKLSQQIGVSVEQMSALKYAADLSGVSMESLTANLTKLGRAMTEATSDKASTAARTFQAIGVAATDASGQLRPIHDVLLDLAEKFSGWQDGAAKATIAMNLFGRSGAQMIPFLNAGRDGIKELTEEAQRLGLVISTDTSKKAEKFNDTLTTISRAWDGMITQIAARLLPTLQQVADWFVKLSQNGDAMKMALDGVDIVIKSLITTGVIVKTVFDTLATAIAAVTAAMILLGSGEFRAAWDTLKQGSTDFTAKVRESVQALKDLWTEANNVGVAAGKLGEGVPAAAAPIVASTHAMRDAMREWKDETRAALDAIVNAPTETFIAKMDAIKKALAEGTINWRTYGQMVRKVEDENRNNVLSTASLLASTLTAVFAKNKTAAIAAAIINTAVGITRALQLPPPFSWAQAALIAATGAAQIAAIRSTNVGGGGSTPSVSGGGADAAEQAQPSQTLTVQGIDPNALFSGEAVRNLAQRLLDFQADGGQVVLK